MSKGKGKHKGKRAKGGDEGCNQDSLIEYLDRAGELVMGLYKARGDDAAYAEGTAAIMTCLWSARWLIDRKVPGRPVRAMQEAVAADEVA